MFNDASPVYQNAIHVARDLRVQGHDQERQKLARQFNGSRHGFGDNLDQVTALRPATRRQGEYQDSENFIVRHSIGSPDPSD